MTTKLLERIVTKFSIKVADLIKYLGISKATIYNYRNMEKFSDIPLDKQYKIFYLFDVEDESGLELILDVCDTSLLAYYLDRISRIFKAQQDDVSFKNYISRAADVYEFDQEIKKIETKIGINGLDDYTRATLMTKINNIVDGASNAEVKEFIDYLDIFEKYRRVEKGDVK